MQRVNESFEIFVSQSHDPGCKNPYPSPEKAMYQKVVLLGVLDALDGYDSRGRKRNDPDDGWIYSNSRDFREVCDRAGINAEMLHKAYRENRLSRSALRNFLDGQSRINGGVW